jgi:hypothetical protein
MSNSLVFQISQFGQNKKGLIVRNCKERYARKAIPCGVLECVECARFRDSSTTLSTECQYLCIVDCDVILNQLSFLESLSIKNVVVCQTSLKLLKEVNEYAYRRIKICIENKRKQFYLFRNEFHQNTSFPKLLKSSSNDVLKEGIFFLLRIIFVYFSNHTGGKLVL